jgi:hypothetical protein
MKGVDLTAQDERELQAWMEEVSEKAELVQAVQDELGRAPEFQALVGTCEASTGEAKTRALRSVADYAVLFAAERLWKGR